MDETNYKQGLHCLNEMVTDALSHGLDCLHYMAALQDQPNLRFCATFQVHPLHELSLFCQKMSWCIQFCFIFRMVCAVVVAVVLPRVDFAGK